MRSFGTRPASYAACALALGSSLTAATAAAQQNPNNQNAGTTPYTIPQTQAPVPTYTPPPAPAPPTAGPAPAPTVTPAQPGYSPPPPTMAPGAPRDTVTQQGATSGVPDLSTTVAGGITADQVAQRAAATSYQAKAAADNAQAAEARADGQRNNFVPRVGLLGRYTRLSGFLPPSFNGIRFPMILDNWVAQATISVPISDYFLKINEGYTAALKQEEAARHDVATARAKSYSDGKIAYYTWLRARSAAVVAEQSLAVAKAHLKDAENQFKVGNASKADVLRAETQVAAAELAVERGKNGALITERQVRVATHAKEDETLVPGESLDSPVPAAPQDLKMLVSEAHGARPELKSLDKNAEAARRLAKVADRGKYPSLSAFGDVTYANPNQRRFPQRDEWFPTWTAGAQITWSPNDVLTAGPAEGDAIARANALDAQKQTVRDGIEIEVAQTYQEVLEADVAVTTTTRQLESAEEAYRVARELFNAGRGTSTTLIDAETALAQSRFEHLNAKVDARLARIRLDHALGRDVKSGGP
ncbi:MAG: TolC family protein [Labilithrix sp.]|nr:TolC family protein [Labilithrix sp.]MCW5813491.1 TolC family protein [Labilithrix sp.]